MTAETAPINPPLAVGLTLPAGPIPMLTLFGCWAAAIAYAQPDLDNERYDAEDPRRLWIKNCENRSWPLPEKLVGVPIAIHAGAFPYGAGGQAQRDARQSLFRRLCRDATAQVPEEAIRTREIAAFVICGEAREDFCSPWRIESERYAFPLVEIWRLPRGVSYNRGTQRIGYVDSTADATLRELAGSAWRVL